VVLLASVGKPSSSAPLAGLRFQLGLTSAGRQFRDALALPWFSEQRFVIPFWVLLWFEHRRQVPLTRERGGHWSVERAGQSASATSYSPPSERPLLPGRSGSG